LKEKVLLGKWSAIAMLLLQTFWVQSYTFARLALTEGQHRPKAGEHRRGSFFSGSVLVPVLSPRLSQLVFE
jgi:hypothetical protein